MKEINDFLWGTPMLVLLVGTGVVMTILTKGFQIVHLSHWLKHTLGSIVTDEEITRHTGKADPSISQFQSICTALASTLGTGNIVGVASALISGGPGAIFWMWVAAFFGMMTSFSENILGIRYRKKNRKGEWCGGPMYYLRDGVGAKPGWKRIGEVLGGMFALFCLLASFGMGNMSQANAVAGNMEAAFGIPPIMTGIALMLITALVILGGVGRIASVTEKIVPFMAVIYIGGTLAVCLAHFERLQGAFAAIIRGAFEREAVEGGMIGYGWKTALTWGMRRGVFSNEAGLGSAVIAHANANVKEPVQQGMWGIFSVFLDTIVMCTLTAVALLTSGLIDLHTGRAAGNAEGAALMGEAFGTVFGRAGSGFVAVSMLLFALATILGWNYFGTKSYEYLFGLKTVLIYRIIYLGAVLCGAVLSLDFVWEISDVWNGLMAVPNLIGILALSPVISKITENYVERKITAFH